MTCPFRKDTECDGPDCRCWVQVNDVRRALGLEPTTELDWPGCGLMIDWARWLPEVEK
ncbi:MAG: hypothetical protein GY700_06420 [Propionibacteriaceae bacterium]|nr:hypothetical protein [Propionibacteriaceae bacterium]